LGLDGGGRGKIAPGGEVRRGESPPVIYYPNLLSA